MRKLAIALLKCDLFWRRSILEKEKKEKAFVPLELHGKFFGSLYQKFRLKFTLQIVLIRYERTPNHLECDVWEYSL